MLHSFHLCPFDNEETTHLHIVQIVVDLFFVPPSISPIVCARVVEFSSRGCRHFFASSEIVLPSDDRIITVMD